MSRYAAVTCVGLLLTVPHLSAAQTDGAPLKLSVREGRPLVGGVYVNGHGPYRFLLDTGATLNQIDPGVARSIGLVTSFETRLTSSTGVVSAPGSLGHTVRLGPATAGDQAFLFSGMGVIRQSIPDIQGVLGQMFLSRFDYAIDLREGRLAFGARETAANGIRVFFELVQGRPAVSTNLGWLVLDSGAQVMVRFGLMSPDASREMITVAGTALVGTMVSTLVIGGRTFWRGESVALPQAAETGAAGLLPLSLFRAVYVCNSGGYVVFE